jgi:YVTN family beta-propeller protein
MGDVAFTPDGKRVLVAANNSLVGIDPSSYNTTMTIAVGQNPSAVTIDRSGLNAYVCNQGSNYLSHISLITNRVTESIPVGAGASAATMIP